jgi:hypothetical protein
MGKYKKGQMTFANLIGLVFVMIIYLTALMPLLKGTLDVSIADIQAHWSDQDIYKAPTIMLLQIFPFMIIVFILMTGLFYAIPQQQPYYGR